jgi:hypothetical protein
MFFGRGKGGAVVDVRSDGLVKLLNSSFDSKLRNFDSRASKIVKELLRARSSYKEACEAFSALDADPEIDNPYREHISSLKSQKGFYSNALKRIFDGWNLNLSDASNLYDKYYTVLSSTERFINETLKANNKSRQTLYHYSRYLARLNTSFSSIGLYRNSLKSEFDKVGKEFSDYNAINDQITKLGILKSDLDTINNSLNSLNEAFVSNNNESIKEEETELASDLSAKGKSLWDLNNEISALHSRVGSLIVPLERVAKKFDHTSGRKRQLWTFLEDPMSNIKNENDYKEFRDLMTGLKKEVDSGSIESKNNLRINSAISDLMSTDLYSILSSLRSFDAKRLELENSVRLSSGALDRLKGSRGTHEKVATDIESLKRSAEEMTANIESTNRSIERLFFEYYDQKIKIIDS